MCVNLCHTKPILRTESVLWIQYVLLRRVDVICALGHWLCQNSCSARVEGMSKPRFLVQEKCIELFALPYAVKMWQKSRPCLRNLTIPRLSPIYLFIYKVKAVPQHTFGGAGGERMYSSYSFTTSTLGEGEWSALRTGCALPTGKGPPVPTEQENGWAPEPVWTQSL
jgi:hypothetical protein